MIVFKAFLKVLNKCKVPILMYSIILIIFGIFQIQSSEMDMNFTATKPDIVIINQDEKKGITESFITYMEQHSNIVILKDEESVRKDALFYRSVNYIITIPNHFREEFQKGNDPKIEIQSTKDYQASLAEMLLNRYFKVADIYREMGMKEEQVISFTEKTLQLETPIEITSKLNTTDLEKTAFYYNFVNYSFLAGCIYVICLVLTSFQKESIRKRTMISCMEYKVLNRYLLLSNGLFALALWFFYVLISFFLLGDIMISLHGICYILNSFLFMLCALSIAFLLGSTILKKETISGIVNVVALGSSFLCGAFVPMEWLPSSVLTIAHVLPSYWFIKTNELLKDIEVINFTTLKPMFFHFGMLLLFTVLFVFLTNQITKRKRKIA